MLTAVEQWAFVARLVEKMRENHGWAGETHIQKAMYFLHSMFKAPVSYQFELYKHGPYSFNLHDDLGRMRANRILDVQPQAPYGPSFGLGSLGEISIRRGRNAVETYGPQIDYVAETLGIKDVRTLERYATALFVIDERPGTDRGVLARRIIELKPHIQLDDAIEAVESVVRIEAEARGRRLILGAIPIQP